jgi:Domain of unknown function (DUF1707)
MSTPASAPQQSPAAPRQGPAGPRRAGRPDDGLRVSDADRGEVADRLAKHYSDGRLDQAEFDDRLDRAMRAKTRADLTGLLSDLPEGPPPPDDPRFPRSQRRQQRQLLKVQLERERLLLKHERQEHRRQERALRWRAMHQLPAIIAVIVVIVITGRIVRDIYSIWLVIAVLGFLWLRHAQGTRRG